MSIQRTDTEPATISPSASVFTWGRTEKYTPIGTAAPKTRLGARSLIEGTPGVQSGSRGVSEAPIPGADPCSMAPRVLLRIRRVALVESLHELCGTHTRVLAPRQPCRGTGAGHRFPGGSCLRAPALECAASAPGDAWGAGCRRPCPGQPRARLGPSNTGAVERRQCGKGAPTDVGGGRRRREGGRPRLDPRRAGGRLAVGVSLLARIRSEE